ncbi:Photosystem II protein [Neosynechococcus sphagnicola sy1]|uniref:Photosystem II lipoprotein Psb27 n=1 Tax=Neosynechococcus sphagnicola sy1 TaxID=1497020 RepID=A0A098TL19_9CYAN|nr:photosystem II protein Psb27 [Neosynechococcus sphagnicola]KGF73020.1 Photosystem II protein [Neosynechococcus sphagnicola sy1]
MKRYFSGLLALVLVVVIGLTGCAGNSTSGLTGNYRQDTLALVDGLRKAIQLPDNAPDKTTVQSTTRQLINDFAALYRRDSSIAKSSSFTTMRTALNSLAGHYSSYPNRPLPEKLKSRLEQELKQVETALNREA